MKMQKNKIFGRYSSIVNFSFENYMQKVLQRKEVIKFYNAALLEAFSA